MGDEITVEDGVTLQIHLPQTAELRLVVQWRRSFANGKKPPTVRLTTTQPGVYRVEAYYQYPRETPRMDFQQSDLYPAEFQPPETA